MVCLLFQGARILSFRALGEGLAGLQSALSE